MTRRMSSIAIVGISLGVIVLVLIMANAARRSGKDRGGADGAPYGGNGRSDGDGPGGDGGGGDGGGGGD